MTWSTQTLLENPRSPAAQAALGLFMEPKRLPFWLFYDDHGSELFERITELPEYYLTRTERKILKRNARSILDLAAQSCSINLIELGSGTARKAEILLSALVRIQSKVDFYPVDVSAAALTSARQRLALTLPQVQVMPLVGSHQESLHFIATLPGRKLVLFAGSSIGNFEPNDALTLLTKLRSCLRGGDWFLLGTDLPKDPELLIAAYDDAAGVTAAFNLNVLTRLNLELDATFDLRRFRHVALWNPIASRIEIHLCSTVNQSVELKALGRSVAFRAGETIHTESSYKLGETKAQSLLRDAGFICEKMFTDELRKFAVHLARVPEARA